MGNCRLLLVQDIDLPFNRLTVSTVRIKSRCPGAHVCPTSAGHTLWLLYHWGREPFSCQGPCSIFQNILRGRQQTGLKLLNTYIGHHLMHVWLELFVYLVARRQMITTGGDAKIRSWFCRFGRQSVLSGTESVARVRFERELLCTAVGRVQTVTQTSCACLLRMGKCLSTYIHRAKGDCCTWLIERCVIALQLNDFVL